MRRKHLDVNAKSTAGELKEIYFENLGYDVDNDPEACRRFIKASRAWIILATSTATDTESATFNREIVQHELRNAEKWYGRYNRKPLSRLVATGSWSR